MPKNPLNDFPYPLNGVSDHSSFTDQDTGTLHWPQNVRSYDPTTNILRGGQRCGHSKYVATRISGAASVQNLNHLVTSAAAGAANSSVRTLTLVAVAGGDVRTVTTSSVNTPAGGTGALSATTPFISSSVLLNKLYFADGTNYKFYDTATDTVSAWTASAGILPAFGANTPRLICTWRGRIVLSGVIGDPQNWFMSAQFDATDFDYAPTVTVSTQAVAGNTPDRAGLCPDIINAMIPYSDDLLIFLCDHSIYQMTGDPMAGGQIDLVSTTVGGAFGDCWCMDANGVIYFMGSRGSLYAMQPGGRPERVSGNRIDERLLTIDWSENIVRMVWDDRFQTVMFYITPLDGSATDNYAYDIRNQAFWPDKFSDTDHQPTAVHLLDGDDPADRACLLGCFDGYLRMIDVEVKADDGEAIDSFVMIGPIQAETNKLRCRELRVTTSEDSDECTVKLLVGHSPEHAFRAPQARFKGTCYAGRTYSMRPGSVGQAMYIVLESTTLGRAWQFESLKAEFRASTQAAGRQL